MSMRINGLVVVGLIAAGAWVLSQRTAGAVVPRTAAWVWGTERASRSRIGDTVTITWPVTNNTGKAQPAQLELQDGEGVTLALGRVVWLRNRTARTLRVSWLVSRVLPGGRGLSTNQVRVFVRGESSNRTLNNRVLQLG